ncbi:MULTISPECIES: hypothetical protein [Pseudomonadaceae]|uniref:hypothetical protein n=1 Tax=Pseudomonadaceae TaxID=135621 RepID=UPI00129858F7|nr:MULTISPECIES: hypothetical protein [Pseudomonadaceae]
MNKTKNATYAIDKKLAQQFDEITRSEFINKSALLNSLIESWVRNYSNNGYERIGFIAFEAKKFKALEKKHQLNIRRLDDEKTEAN